VSANLSKTTANCKEIGSRAGVRPEFRPRRHEGTKDVERAKTEKIYVAFIAPPRPDNETTSALPNGMSLRHCLNRPKALGLFHSRTRRIFTGNQAVKPGDQGSLPKIASHAKKGYICSVFHSEKDLIEHESRNSS
jgi:hypothetical protein